ncbi:metallo-beta-lactamase domain-containing protein 1-like [Polyodon spathula]|uniref:metallo-beta-lactamase domain-containing protein 1-like n=1 Tax=Polyodon spathula TaxID=7913 RepID=UPI001B7DF94D|nr:metallo-beta-lactamase domain-containing protein 1-like [Polyodon spathula]XP_041094296.1 metallo-beta-lactamase domain-containing protein 1-like [Polyodon spathula]
MSVPLSVRTEPLGRSVIRGDPYTVWVLKEGYCVSEADGSCRADGSITLLTGPLVIVVDTGGPWDRQLLLDRLAERGLQTGDVSHVICTHGHSDHVGNLNLFPGATLAVGCDVSQGDHYLSHGLGEGQPLALDPHVEVVPTPGHAGRDTSVLVLIPAIHIHATGRAGCCANRCGMFLSIAFAAVGFAGALYSLAVALLGLVNGPTCLFSYEGKPIWGAPFSEKYYGSNESYLVDRDLWKRCEEPKHVVEFNMVLFSILTVASAIELLLCGFQAVNGLFGCLCGTCGGKGQRA